MQWFCRAVTRGAHPKKLDHGLLLDRWHGVEEHFEDVEEVEL